MGLKASSGSHLFSGEDHKDGSPTADTESSPDFGSFQDLVNRVGQYVYIILIIFFVHVPKLMVFTVSLVIMCDPTFVNFLFMIWFFVSIRVSFDSRVYYGVKSPCIHDGLISTCYLSCHFLFKSLWCRLIELLKIVGISLSSHS